MFNLDLMSHLETTHHDCSHYSETAFKKLVQEAGVDGVKGKSPTETLSLAPAKSGSRLSLSVFAFNFLPEHWGLTADRRHNNKAHIKTLIYFGLRLVATASGSVPTLMSVQTCSVFHLDLRAV